MVFRVALCLESDSSLCGDYQEAAGQAWQEEDSWDKLAEKAGWKDNRSEQTSHSGRRASRGVQTSSQPSVHPTRAHSG